MTLEDLVGVLIGCVILLAFSQGMLLVAHGQLRTRIGLLEQDRSEVSIQRLPWRSRVWLWWCDQEVRFHRWWRR